MLLKRRNSYRYNAHILSIPDKANRILNIILVAIVLILARVWHLTVIQYDVKLEEARKPRARVIVESAKRATIRDRFNQPLAINKVRYQASILYSQLTDIPAIAWQKDINGKRVKHFKRREYIAELSRLLGRELQMDPERIEDLIHSKASLYYQIPFILKDDISEREYYRLKMLEKDWVGIQVQRVPKRYYPQGRVGAEIIGYMGAINRKEYDAIIHEIKALEKYLKEMELGEDFSSLNESISPSEARARLKELQEKAYTINDYVGKSGIEGMFEEELRGFQGRKSYYADAKGNFLRELPAAREPLSGHRLLLTISSELQEYAEQLLAQNEQIREGWLSIGEHKGKSPPLPTQPWIKGGAIVAMDPNNGEVIALASHPRFDPNDFIPSGDPKINQEKRSHIVRWFENETYLSDVWDQKRPLIRELFDDKTNLFYDEERILTWEHYLASILPADHAVTAMMKQIDQLRAVIGLQQDVQQLLDLTGQSNLYYVFNRLYQSDPNHIPYSFRPSAEAARSLEDHFLANAKAIEVLKKRLDPFLGEVKNNKDKVLAVDLCRLIGCMDHFPHELLNRIGHHTLSFYRNATVAKIAVNEWLRKETKQLFHVHYFKQWRQDHEKEFLKEKRKEEKLANKYAKPYIDYLDAKENELFEEFWQLHGQNLLTFFTLTDQETDRMDESLQLYLTTLLEAKQKIAENDHPLQRHDAILKKALKGLSFDLAEKYLQAMRSFKELDRPLLGHYKHLRNTKGQQLERHLAAAFYPIYGFGYARSQAYRQATIQGSIFKLVTAYEALRQHYQNLPENTSLDKLNPLEIIDDAHRHGNARYVGYQLDGTPIPQMYKGGRLPRSLRSGIGRIDLLKALEVSSNPYFSLLASDVIDAPQDLVDAARIFSYGSRTGIDLPGEIPGKVPHDIEFDRTGLYSLAIGQHSLVVTPLQTAVMLSALANGGKVLKPKIVNLTAGRERKSGQDQIINKSHFAYRESLALVGIEFPLFTAVELREEQRLVKRVSTEVKREVFLPQPIRHLLFKAMHQMVARSQVDGMSGLSKLYRQHPEALQAYASLKNDLIGKSSTSEALEHLNLDSVCGTSMCKHVWFGGISFEQRSSQDGGTTFVSHDEFGQPELVVVVYLRYGGFGKEAAPLAAQIVKKWRDIKQRYHAIGG